MSFDIYFQPCRFGPTPVLVENRFTGESKPELPNEPLKPAQMRAVRKILQNAKTAGPDEFGCYLVELDDGGAAEVFAKDFATGCMAAVRGITPDLLQFLFEVLEAGQWAMLPVMEPAVAITTSLDYLHGVPDDFPRTVACGTADELGVLLTKGVKAWEKYRDQVVSGKRKKKPNT